MEKIISSLRYRVVAGLPLALLLMLFALPAQAELQKAQAEFYKWTDESGQVHYTQTSPPEQQAEKIEVKTGAASPVVAPPAEKDGVLRCGSISLPTKRLDPVTNIAMFKQARAIWQKYVDENDKKSDEASRQGVTDRRCAIGYANKELQALSDVEQDINTNYERVTEELEELQESVKACDDLDREDEELSVAACKRQYRPRIKQLEIMQRRMVAPKNIQ